MRPPLIILNQKEKQMKNKLLILVLCVAGTLLIGASAGIATASGISNWYLTIQKPFFNPPNYLFGPVWTLLYTILGITLYMIIVKKTPQSKKTAYLLFGAQLVLNFFWSFIFFSMHNLLFAFIEILVLWFFILLMIRSFYKISKTAALLNIPYLCWVSFASLLTGTIYFIN
jgi:tryptophan-rich sensory protein